MSEYDQRGLFDNQNAQAKRSKGQASSTEKDSEPYNTDHLPKLTKDSPALNFKPMEDIQKKASLDKQTLLIIENGATKTRGWQLTKTEFINQVKAMVDTKVNGLLKHVGFTTDDCPWLNAFYAELGTYPAQGIEQILRQYLPQGQTIESTNDFLAKLAERIEVPIKHWIKTRKIQDVPELVEKKIAETQPGGNTNGHFDPFTAAKQSNTSIPPELKGKLEEYLGASLSSIRLHTGAEAEKVLAQKKARALTLGQDIFLDLKQYSLESPKGMAILAHEIVHAMQQMGATSMDASNNSDALEADANRSVWGLLRRWMQWGKGFAAAGANMKSGLKVAKCSKDKKEEVKENIEEKPKTLTELAELNKFRFKSNSYGTFGYNMQPLGGGYGMECAASSIIFMLKSYGLIPPQMTRKDFEIIFTPLHVYYGDKQAKQTNRTYTFEAPSRRKYTIKQKDLLSPIYDPKGPTMIQTGIPVPTDKKKLQKVPLTCALLRGASGIPGSLQPNLNNVLKAFKNLANESGYEGLKEYHKNGVTKNDFKMTNMLLLLQQGKIPKEYFKEKNHTIYAGVGYESFYGVEHYNLIVREHSDIIKIGGKIHYIYPVDDAWLGPTYAIAPEPPWHIYPNKHETYINTDKGHSIFIKKYIGKDTHGVVRPLCYLKNMTLKKRMVVIRSAQGKMDLN